MRSRQRICRVARAMLAVTMVSGLSAARAQAGFLFFSDPSAFQAQLAQQGIVDEPLIFNQPGLITTGTSVQGLTASTRKVVNVEAGDQEITTPTTGEPRVEAVTGDIHTVGFDAFDYTAAPPFRIHYYRSVEFVLNFAPTASGTLNIIATDQFFDDGSTTFPITGGPMFVGIIATGSTLFFDSGVFGSTATGDPVDFASVSQIRLGGVGAVPEPTSLVLLATGLGVLVFARVARIRPAGRAAVPAAGLPAS